MTSRIDRRVVLLFLLAISAWAVLFAAYLYTHFLLADPRSVWLLLAAFPAWGATVFLTLSLLPFPLAYSIFGRNKRTPFPTEVPQLVIRRSWSTICYFRASFPMVTWQIYSSGLGISIWGFGKVFLDCRSILAFEQIRPGLFRLQHSCPELRNPVIMPARTACAAMSVWSTTKIP